jgi:hypothetical protein
MKPSETNFPFNLTQSVFEQSSGFRNAMGHAAIGFWNRQEQVLETMQEYANTWFERRNTSVQEALNASQQMIEAETPIEAMREYQKWAIGSFERTIDDGISCQKHLMSMGALLAPPLSPSVERTEREPVAAESRQRSQSRAAA